MKFEDFKIIENEAVNLCGREGFINERSFYVEQILKNNKLKEANTNQLLKEFLYGLSLGFTFNPQFDYCNIIPKNKYTEGKKVGVIGEFRPTYKGVAWAAQKFGVVKQIYAHVVYEGDEFDVIMGTEVEIIHKPKFKSKKITHVYAVAILESDKKYIEVLTIEDINVIKSCSDGFKYDKDNTSPWNKFEGQMCRKAAILRLCNYIPKDRSFQKIVEAEQREYKIDEYGSQANYIRSLINTSNYEDDYKSILEGKISDMNTFEAKNMIVDLKENQINMAESATLGNHQKEIQKALDKIIENPKK